MLMLSLLGVLLAILSANAQNLRLTVDTTLIVQEPVTFALYYNDPNSVTPTETRALVWWNHTVGSEIGDYFWTLTWAVGFATGSSQVAPGVSFSAKGTKIPVSVDGAGVNNVHLKYSSATCKSGAWMTTGTTAPSSKIPVGSFGSDTQGAIYDRTCALDLNVALLAYMGQPCASGVVCPVEPVLASSQAALPNIDTQWLTHPRYYIGLTSQDVGVVVTASMVSNPEEINFGGTNAVTHVICTINTKNVFSCVQQIAVPPVVSVPGAHQQIAGYDWDDWRPDFEPAEKAEPRSRFDVLPVERLRLAVFVLCCINVAMMAVIVDRCCCRNAGKRGRWDYNKYNKYDKVAESTDATDAI